MFRRQQTQQTKPNTGIKSFSSRVERRRKAAVEEKKEEPVKQVKAIPKRTAKAEDLPNFKAATTLSGDNVDHIEIITEGSGTSAVQIAVLYFNPLVGDYQIEEKGNEEYQLILTDEQVSQIPFNESNKCRCKLVFPSYQPETTNNAIILPGFNQTASIFVQESETEDRKELVLYYAESSSDIEITDLYLVNSTYKTAGEVFSMKTETSGTTTTTTFEGIKEYDKLTYISNNPTHKDVKNLHLTNYLYKNMGETGKVTTNLIVTGAIPKEMYDVSAPFKVNDKASGSEVFKVDPNGTYQIDTVNALPTPDTSIVTEGSTDNVSSIDLSSVKLGNGDNVADTGDNAIDLTNKFKNFYVNNVIIKPDDKDDIITRFTQTLGTEYMGSNVTILAAPVAAGEGGVTEPVNDPLVPLIRNLDYENNTITFTIKPNEKQGLLVANQKNAGSQSQSDEDKGEIIIDLSSSPLSTQLAEWDPSATDGTTIAFIQEAVILNGDFSTTAPDVRLNGESVINKVTIKYFKKGATSADDKIETVTLAAGTPGEGEEKLAEMTSGIGHLYVVNGTVGSKVTNQVEVKRLLTPLTTSALGEKTITLPANQINGTFTAGTSVTTIIENYHATNIILTDGTNPLKNDSTNGVAVDNNFVVCGTLPNWMIDSNYLRTTGYDIKKTGDNEWTVIATNDNTAADAVISTVNWLPVDIDGYGELDIGVDFTTTAATLGSADSPIALPEDSTGTKNELKLLNFNMNEIYVKQSKPTADLDLTATVNHNYEGATVYNAVEMGGASGTASPITDLISGFEVSGTTLTIKIKPSNDKLVQNVLKPYRKDTSDGAAEADMKAVNLDITGNLNLCDKLDLAIGTKSINSIVIEQEALILDDTHVGNTTSGLGKLDVTMNQGVEVASITLKYLKLNNNKYEEVSIPAVDEDLVIVPTHKIDKLYFTHGTILTQANTNLRLLTPLVATTVFTSTTTGTGDSATTTYSVNIEDELIKVDTPDSNQIAFIEEATAVEELICTNIKNMVVARGKTNLVVGGNEETGIIPTEIFKQFDSTNGIPLSITGEITTAQSAGWTVTSINDFPCKGYGALDIGINTTGSDSYRSILNLIPPEKPADDDDENNDNMGDGEFQATPVRYEGKDGFYVNQVYVPRGTGDQQIEAQFTSHVGLNSVGALIMTPDETGNIQPSSDATGDFIKIKTLDQLYNLMMEPRTYVGKSSDNSSETPVGILFATEKTAKLNDVLLEEGAHLIYYPALDNNKDERLQLVKPEEGSTFVLPDNAKEVNIRGEILNNEDQDGDANNGKRSVKVRIYLEYVDDKSTAHRIPYGVVGNGPFEKSELDPKYEVDGNKWNLKIEDIMKSINERQVNVDSSTGKLELSVESLTDDEKKIKKSEMYEYICEIKRTLNAMPFNSRYLNEILGYLSKCLAFEQVRLPSIRESDNQGLESVNEEYDAETNPDGWIEKYTEEFEKNGIIYKVVSDYDNYKFRDGGKHDDLINDMRSKLAQIYMFNELGETLKLDQIMNKLLNEYTDIWMKYYKGLVVPNDLIMTDFSDIEIYEDENIYKVFEGNSEEGTHVISQLTDGSAEDEDGEELKAFIEEIMKYFKDEINEVTGTKKDIKGITIEDMVAYEDPLKETTSSNATGEEIDDVLTNNENNLIEYSQMLSTIQGERNKLQRQGNKNKIILKFTQTVKGTFFEILGKEKMNSEQKSQIFGFFLSELKEYVNHTKKTVSGMDRKSRRGVKTIQAIPDEIEGKRYLRITKVPEFYVGDPLDWINDNYYSNKIFLQNCDNLYLGIDPELDQRIEPVGTPVSAGSSELKEQEMIGYYILKIQY